MQQDVLIEPLFLLYTLALEKVVGFQALSKARDKIFQGS